MTIQEIKNLLLTSDYNFLRKNPSLLNNLIFLTLGGSYAYGTNIECSDIDIRGCRLNSANEILLGEDYGVFTDKATDTTIYSFNNLISRLSNMNPNSIELLGCKSEHYLLVSEEAQALLDNKQLFLSQKCIGSFGGYAENLLWRLKVNSNYTIEQNELEEHLLQTIENASKNFKDRYMEFDTDSIKLYLDDALNSDLDTEIFMDINLMHYPLRDYKSMWAELNNIAQNHMKLGERSRKAIKRDKLGKHMMHLVRLYLMCFDILEKEKIITYRKDDHDLLMDIRNGKFLTENQVPTPEFFEYLDTLKQRFDYAKKNTSLPDQPDYKKIKEFQAEINKKVILGEF